VCSKEGGNWLRSTRGKFVCNEAEKRVEGKTKGSMLAYVSMGRARGHLSVRPRNLRKKKRVSVSRSPFIPSKKRANSKRETKKKSQEQKCDCLVLMLVERGERLIKYKMAVR